MRRNGIGPVAAIDIDGTLGNYHLHFLRFAEEWYGRPMPKPEDINPGLPLHKFMQTSKSTYRQCKLAYRQGGLKRSMPVYPGARELTARLRRRGVEIWICTTRPYLRLDNIDPDTRHWLRRNGIQYDAVLYGPNKYRDLIKQVEPYRIIGVLDDLPEMVDQAEQFGLFTMLRDQPYNQHRTDSIRIYDLPSAEVMFDMELRIWRGKHDAPTKPE